MKLFTQYSRINLLANIAIFLVASVAFYYSLRFVLINEIDEDLQIEEEEILAAVQKHDRLPESFSFSDQVIHFTPTAQKINRKFSTVKMMEEDEDNKLENFRRLTFGIRANGQAYQVDVSKSLEGTNNLLRSILIVSISTILLILLVSTIINRVLLKNLWKPFYHSLNAVRNFRISKNQPLAFSVTPIEEFALMNQTLEGITTNSRLEYLALKTFSENASHEIQTPIAIIRSKLDLLIQNEKLTDNGGQTVQSAYNAVEKLSRLSQSLLLLAKIENNQFEEVEMIDLRQKLQEKLQDFQELLQLKLIGLHTSMKNASIKMNKELADILLNNLLSNAANHNYEGGSISIVLKQGALTVSNTSNKPELDGEKAFSRFYKPAAGSLQNGLGLSIIKQIAEVSSFTLQYSYTNTEHSFTVTWNNNNSQ